MRRAPTRPGVCVLASASQFLWPRTDYFGTSGRAGVWSGRAVCSVARLPLVRSDGESRATSGCTAPAAQCPSGQLFWSRPAFSSPARQTDRCPRRHPPPQVIDLQRRLTTSHAGPLIARASRRRSAITQTGGLSARSEERGRGLHLKGLRHASLSRRLGRQQGGRRRQRHYRPRDFLDSRDGYHRGLRR